MRTLRYAFFLTIIAAAAYIIAVPYLNKVSEHTILLLNEFELTDLSKSKIMLASGINILINTFLLCLIGAALAPKTGLKWDWIQAVIDRRARPSWDQKSIWMAVLWGAAATVVLAVLIQTVFAPNIPGFSEVNEEQQISWLIGLTTVFQGGITEELLMRFGLMTLIVWLLSKIFSRKKSQIPAWIYWTGILAAALLFGLGHLPLGQSIYGTSFWVSAYILIGNVLAGIGFGLLYWKKGLEYAMISHMTADLMLHAVLPYLMKFV